MKILKKFLRMVCLSLLLMFAMLSANLSAMVANASTNTSIAEMSPEDLYKKAALVLKDEYSSGAHSENNQWMLYQYDLKTIDEYDYIDISISSSLSVEIFNEDSLTYQYDTQNRSLDVIFCAAANALDFSDLAIENTNEGKITISMSIYLNNQLVNFKEYRISVCITPYGSFSAPYDIRSAKWLYNEWLLEEDIILYDEYKIRDNSLFRATYERTGMMISPMSSISQPNPVDVVLNYNITVSTSTLNISGTVTWTDTNGAPHPARQVGVEIMHFDGMDFLLADLETDNTGNFSITGIDKTYNIYIKVSAATREGLGVESFLGPTYSFSTTPRIFTGDTPGVARERGTDTADAFYVHQALIVGESYASAMGYMADKPNVTFPRSESQYNPLTDTIWLIDDDYCDWDVILHEYGHFIMDKLNIENQPIGSHGWTDILTDNRANKEEGIKLAWGEGWSTYFSISSQLHQDVSALNIPNAGDVSYHDTIDGSGVGINIHVAGTIGKGEGNELAVARVLLNLAYHPTNPTVLTYQELWNLCNNSKAKHLSDFMAQVYAYTPKSQISAIGTILRNENIVPNLTTSTAEIIYDSPTFTWSIDTANVSTTYLDEFILIFMDTSYNTRYSLTVQMDNPYVLKASHLHTLLPYQLDLFKSNVPYEFYWGIQVNQYEASVITGPYYSELNYMTHPTFDMNMINNLNEYSVDGILNSNLTTVTVPATYNGMPVTRINTSAFANRENLSNANIPFSITSIGYNAFGGCNNLASIEIPFVGETLNGTTNVKFDYIFGESVPQSLKTVTITGGNSIGTSAFANCQNLETIIFPNTVTTIGYGAFAYCASINSFYILSSVTSIGNDAFFGCTSLESITVDPTNENYSSQGGILYDKLEKTFIHIPNAISGTVTLPSSIKDIPAYAFENRTQLIGITSPINLRSIGNNAFSGCSGLANISILNGVESIGLQTFWGCTGLTEINIPNSIESIGASAFTLCSGALSLTIPSSVTSIDVYAFANCTQLETVNVLRPSSSGITAIGQNVFLGCAALVEICVPDAAYKTASNWSAYSSIIFSDTATSGLAYTLINGGTEYSVSKGTATAAEVLIPDRYLKVKVTAISNNGFANYNNMTGITISTIITSIGSYAFSNCEGLTSIVIPNNVTSLGSHAFYNCSGLLSATISSGITSIADSAFAYCDLLTNITIPVSVTSIGENAFSSCNALTSFTIPAGINSIGNNAFSNCINLKIVNIIRPLSLGVIALGGAAAFGGSTALYAIYVPDSESQTAYRSAMHWSNYNSVIFADNGTPGLVYTLINGNTAYSVTRGTATSNNIIILPTYNNLPVTAIGNSGFINRSNIVSVTIPNTVEVIGTSAFSSCTGISSIVIPSSVETIGQNAFRYCSSLVSLTILDGVTNIENYAFANCGLTSVTIPNSVTNIGSYAFYSCSGMTTSLVIPNSVMSIGAYAFSGCSGLTGIIIPNSVSSISNNLLYNCSALTSITIPSGITSIGNYALYGCSSLTSITVPSGVTSIGEYSFANCTGLTAISLPSGVTSVGSAAFNNCSKLKTVSLPNTINAIGAAAFYSCTSLTGINIPTSVTSIPLNLFYNCSALTGLTIPSSITSIGNYAFYNCTKLNNVTIPSNVTSIGDYAFSGCSAFTAITIRSNVTSVGNRAFYNCTNLAITWIYNATMTAANFSDYLKFVTFQSTSIAANAFSGCTKLSDLSNSSNVTSIGTYAFYGCTGMSKIYIPSSVTTMGSNVFQNCSNLYVYTAATSKPSGWNSTWNSSNRPVYWKVTGGMDVISGFGYNGSTYYWTGAVQMTISGHVGYRNSNNGVFLFVGNSILAFSVRTLTSKNAWSKINGTLSFSGAYSHTSTVSVSITNSVTISNGSFSINTANLANGTYTLSMYSSFTRGSWSGSSTQTFTFIVDK